MSQAKALWWVWCTEYPEDGATIHEGATEEEAKADFLTDTDSHDDPPEMTADPITAEEMREFYAEAEDRAGAMSMMREALRSARDWLTSTGADGAPLPEVQAALDMADDVLASIAKARGEG